MSRQADFAPAAALEAFTAEMRDTLPAVAAALDAAESDPGGAEAGREAHRLVHSLKGAASIVGLASLSYLLNLAEERLESSVSRGGTIPAPAIAAVRLSLPRFAAYLDNALNGRALEQHALALRDALADAGSDILADDPLRALAAIDHREISSWRPMPEAPPVTAPPPVFDIELEPTAVAPELAEVFSQEAQDHLQTIARLTAQLSAEPSDREPLRELRRAVHTLKGAAGVVGYKAASKLAHRMEDLLDRLFEGTATATPEAVRALSSSSDALDELIVGPIDAAVLRPRIAGLFQAFDALLGSVALPAPPAEPEPPAEVPASADADHASELSAAPAVERRNGAERRQGEDRRQGDDRRGGGRMLRVPVQRLDDLVRAVSELVINRSSFEQHHTGLVEQVDELKFSAARLRRVAHRLESDYEVRALAGSVTANAHGFDELEFDRYTEFHLLTRELAETANDIATIGGRVDDAIGDFDADLTRLGRLTREIQDRTMEFRLVPLDTIASRLERAVRVTADACGKAVDFALEGGHTALDKSLVEEMADPLLHLLRNAVDHGIETSEVRTERGKPARGRITVRAYHEGTDVLIEVQDDGRGMDADRIRRAAVDRGLLGEAQAAALPREALYALVFEPGFTTASHVSEISGRGVGMDIVKSKMTRVNGRIDIASEPGAGTTMALRLPMTLAITRALVVRAGGETLGVPLAAVRQIVRPQSSTLARVGTERVVTVDGRTYPVRALADVLALPHPADAAAAQPILIANLGGAPVALAVDEVLNSRDVVVKPLGTHLRRVRGVWGAALMGDGTIVLVLNAADLLDSSSGQPAAAPKARARTAVERRVYTILIVDDSLSMRHVLTTAVKKAGWEAVQARDGIEALEIVHRAPPDLILLDVEMPRMDGFEFLSAVRSQPAFAALPIVMLTSRGGEKHRQKATSLGVTDYMVKPYHEDALLRNIDRLITAASRPGMKAAS